MDVALGIEALVPKAQYYGSTTANTEECFDNLNWLDSREKPTWKQIQDAYADLPESVTNPQKFEAEARIAAEAKLAALGLTAEDLKALNL